MSSALSSSDGFAPSQQSILWSSCFPRQAQVPRAPGGRPVLGSRTPQGHKGWHSVPFPCHNPKVTSALMTEKGTAPFPGTEADWHRRAEYRDLLSFKIWSSCAKYSYPVQSVVIMCERPASDAPWHILLRDAAFVPLSA